MPEDQSTGDWNEFASVDPEEGEVLAQRLRLVAESLNTEFQGLSRTDAERMIFAAAQEVLSLASVVQFVPTFAERRARHLLQTGEGGPGFLPDLPTPRPELPEEGPSVAGLLPAPPAPPAEPARPIERTPPPPANGSSAPSWPDAFYATEAKRLLQRAQDLRVTTLSAIRSDRGAIS